MTVIELRKWLESGSIKDFNISMQEYDHNGSPVGEYDINRIIIDLDSKMVILA